MGTNDVSKSCVKCQKMVKSSEKVLVCGLWCRKAFHNDCVGLTNSETHVVTCSNERIKFHCETCENRLGMELVAGQKTHDTNKLDNCVNDCLFELVEKILKLTSELSNDNSVINRKLDTVISTNKRLEEYILQSPKCHEKRGGEIIDYSDECMKIIEENNYTSSDNLSVNSASLSQQIDDNSSSVHIGSDIPRQLSDQEPPVAGESSSNCLRELEMNDDHSLTQDLPSTIKEEYIPSEEFLVRSVRSIVKTEYEGSEEKAEIEIEEEECSSSLAPLVCGSSSIEKIVDDVDGESGREDIFEELKHEVEPGNSAGKPESTIALGLDDHGNKGDSSHSVTKDSRTAGNGCSTTKYGVSYGNNRTLKQTTNVKHNSRLHSVDRPFNCSVYNKTFSQKCNLQVHSRLHSGERPFSFSVCNQAFRHKDTLKKHSYLHSGERPYCCSVCNKTFTRNCHLQEHLRLHSGERPFSCSVCNKMFTHKSSLQVHLRLHSGERPFCCSVCNKTFTQNGHLQEHLRLHSGERPFSCSVCNKTFRQKSTLRAHSRLHSGKTPIQL